MKNVKSLTKKFLNLTLVAMIGVSFLSCNPDNPQPTPQNVTLQWTATIGGQTHSWQGSYPDNHATTGDATTAINQSDGTLNIVLVNQTGPKSLGIKLPNANIGSSVISGGSLSNPNALAVTFSNGQSVTHSTLVGGQVTVNLTEYATSVYGSVKGTFSGTIGVFPGGGTVPISGSFQAVRYN
jgi:hypothetical protein